MEGCVVSLNQQGDTARNRLRPFMTTASFMTFPTNYGNPMNETPNRATDETAVALRELAERYQLITAAAATQLRRDHFNTDAQAIDALHQLAPAGSLREVTLFGNVTCFVPEVRRCKKPLSETTKIRALAMLSVCASASHHRTRLTGIELEKYLPELQRPGLPMNYYVDLSHDQPKLGFLRVDTGGHGRWDRIVAKALDDVRKHQIEPAFRRFIQRDALEIRVVTPLHQKAIRITRALNDRPTDLGQSIEVSVVPELLNLIAPIRS